MTEKHDITTSDAARAMGRKGGKAKNKKKPRRQRGISSSREQCASSRRSTAQRKKKTEPEKCECPALYWVGQQGEKHERIQKHRGV